jgi:D-glycero-D-manno-heptose 1,7-bisphosphate phosphatase
LKPGIFLDRDNTLVVDHGYTHRVADFVWMAGAAHALRRFHAAGLPIFVVTNQGGIALGLFNEEDLHLYHSHLRAEAVKIGSKITDIAFCPHHPAAIATASHGACCCRKPKPGMILQLAKTWGVALEDSVMIGDRQSDVETGARAGCHSYLFDGRNLDLLAREIMCRHF